MSRQTPRKPYLTDISDAAWEWIAPLLAQRDGPVEIVKRPTDQRGFQIQPKRWMVERSLGWLNPFRRLSKDYENSTTLSERTIKIAHSQVSCNSLSAVNF